MSGPARPSSPPAAAELARRAARAERLAAEAPGSASPLRFAAGLYAAQARAAEAIDALHVQRPLSGRTRCEGERPEGGNVPHDRADREPHRSVR